MLVIGLTGGIGSGKTTVTDRFAFLGIDIVDSDEIAREVVAPGSNALEQIKDHFGENVLLSDGQLNRRRLREIVFESSIELKWLESVTHPAIRELTEQKLFNATSEYTILSAPLLIEAGSDVLADRVCVVDIPEPLQLLRSTKRDTSSEKAIRKIMEKQVSREKRLARADDVIDNSRSLAHTFEQVEKLHQFYLSLARSH